MKEFNPNGVAPDQHHKAIQDAFGGDNGAEMSEMSVPDADTDTTQRSDDTE